jgi:(1->4)-alpha-D-glucan 1-alpha-D-glucosylmutase
VTEPSPGSFRVPISTYRLQLRAGFGFRQAAELAEYLAALGVTHAYLSPILQANAGSAHGYDVVDHSRISADLGGEDEFRAMVKQFHGHGLGVLVDVVPNHMARPTPESLNKQLWSVLYRGKESEYAHWFDIDWDAQDGKLLMPILNGPLEKCLGDLVIDTAPRTPEDAEHRGPVLRYFDHVLPLRDGVADLPLGVLLAQQHYRLTGWRDAATQLNWRRFFDVDTLIAIRVEDPDVFTATHRVLLRLYDEGLIDGLRIDHPDGLADPEGYLRRLAASTGSAWVVVEKILAYGEELPSWPCAGTTGYDALSLVGGLFVDPAGAAALTRAYVRFVSSGGRTPPGPPGPGGPIPPDPPWGGSLSPQTPSAPRQSFAEVATDAKRYVANGAFTAELSRLIRLFARAAYPALDGFSAADLHDVLVAMLAAFGAYRAYVTPGEPPPGSSVAVVAAAVSAARERLDARLHPALDGVCAAVLSLGDAAHDAAQQAARAELVIRFGQTTGPVLAKGVEDTAFYRWARLAVLNEVGGDPDIFGISPAEFHVAAGRLAARWPTTLTALSTHDTKRQEDVRARLTVLAEWPEEWAHQVTEWHGLAMWLTDGAAAQAAQQEPEPDLEYLMWQTLVGAWLAGRDRVREYLGKAMREAKTRTSWTAPDLGYESAVLGLADAVLGDPELTSAIAGFVARIAPDARVNSLGAKLVQLTMPGVPDVYQGCELVGLALVDPDNRRPVDYQRRRRLLAALQAGPDLAAGLDAEKMLVTSRALWLRRDHPEWFTGAYTPLAAEGPAAEHVIAFVRGEHAVTVATRLPAGLRRRGGWADTALPLPELHWHDVLTGTRHAGLRPLLAELTWRLPVALLIPERVYLAEQGRLTNGSAS